MLPFAPDNIKLVISDPYHDIDDQVGLANLFGMIARGELAPDNLKIILTGDFPPESTWALYDLLFNICEKNKFDLKNAARVTILQAAPYPKVTGAVEDVILPSTLQNVTEQFQDDPEKLTTLMNIVHEAHKEDPLFKKNQSIKEIRDKLNANIKKANDKATMGLNDRLLQAMQQAPDSAASKIADKEKNQQISAYLNELCETTQKSNKKIDLSICAMTSDWIKDFDVSQLESITLQADVDTAQPDSPNNVLLKGFNVDSSAMQLIEFFQKVAKLEDRPEVRVVSTSLAKSMTLALKQFVAGTPIHEDAKRYTEMKQFAWTVACAMDASNNIKLKNGEDPFKKYTWLTDLIRNMGWKETDPRRIFNTFINQPQFASRFTMERFVSECFNFVDESGQTLPEEQKTVQESRQTLYLHLMRVVKETHPSKYPEWNQEEYRSLIKADGTLMLDPNFEAIEGLSLAKSALDEQIKIELERYLDTLKVPDLDREKEAKKYTEKLLQLARKYSEEEAILVYQARIRHSGILAKYLLMVEQSNQELNDKIQKCIAHFQQDLLVKGITMTQLAVLYDVPAMNTELLRDLSPQHKGLTLVLPAKEKGGAPTYVETGVSAQCFTANALITQESKKVLANKIVTSYNEAFAPSHLHSPVEGTDPSHGIQSGKFFSPASAPQSPAKKPKPA